MPPAVRQAVEAETTGATLKGLALEKEKGPGLAISRWIADAHGGTVTLDESGPSGSVFVVRLPLHGGACAAGPASAL